MKRSAGGEIEVRGTAPRLTRCGSALGSVTPEEVSRPLARLGSLAIKSRGTCPGSAHAPSHSLALENTSNSLYNGHI